MTNTGTVSKNADELQAIIDTQAERLRALDATIKDQERLLAAGHHLGLAYNTIPEHGDAQRLLHGEVPVLTADPAHSTVKTGDGGDDHVLIEGDNLTALTMLQATHKGKVNVIYIDPPCNTGNQDFVYNDRFVDPEDSYRHSKWLSFMRPRLVLARELLTSDGVIFVSIDDHEQAYLRVLMDEVFGEQNFIANMIWHNRNPNDGIISTDTEYVLCYAKKKENVIPIYKDEHGSWQGASIERAYKNPDNDPRGDWRNAGHTVTSQRAHYSYSINVLTGEITEEKINAYPYYYNEVWGYPSSRISGLWEDGRIFWKKLGNKVSGFQVKKFKNEESPHTALQNFIPKSFSSTKNGKEDIENVLGKDIFGYPKPVNLIKLFINTIADKSAIVLDFFAGSGTTGQAVAELNREDGGHRRAILVTNNFEQDGAENGIARGVTAVRMRRVLTGEGWADGEKHDPLPGNLRYYRIGFKALADDADVFTGAFTEPGDIAGGIALARGAHDVVSAESLADACPVLAAAGANDKAMVLTNGYGDRVLVYADAVAVMNGDDEYEDALAGFHEWAGDKGTVYLASLDDADDEGIVYPLPYVRTVRRTVNGLERQGLLAREK